MKVCVEPLTCTHSSLLRSNRGGTKIHRNSPSNSREIWTKTHGNCTMLERIRIRSAEGQPFWGRNLRLLEREILDQLWLSTTSRCAFLPFHYFRAICTSCILYPQIRSPRNCCIFEKVVPVRVSFYSKSVENMRKRDCEVT